MFTGPAVEIKQGLVVLLDALGTKAAADSDGWPHVTQEWARVVLSAKAQRRLTIATDLPNAPPPPGLEYLEVEPQAFGFGDTMLVAFSTTRADHELLKAATFWMRSEIHRSIEDRRPLRGAVSLGTYCVDSAGLIAMGPAVADAADWYAAAEWAGLVLTPMTAKVWTTSGAKYSRLPGGGGNPASSATLWHEFSVPMSKSAKPDLAQLSMYALAWPGVDPPTRTAVEAAFRSPPPSSAARTKLDNTLRFFDEVRLLASSLRP